MPTSGSTAISPHLNASGPCRTGPMTGSKCRMYYTRPSRLDFVVAFRNFLTVLQKSPTSVKILLVVTPTHSKAITYGGRIVTDVRVILLAIGDVENNMTLNQQRTTSAFTSAIRQEQNARSEEALSERKSPASNLQSNAHTRQWCKPLRKTGKEKDYRSLRCRQQK